MLSACCVASLSFQAGLHVQRPALGARSVPTMLLDAHAATLLADAAILLPPDAAGAAAQQATAAAAEQPGFFDRRACPGSATEPPVLSQTHA